MVTLLLLPPNPAWESGLKASPIPSTLSWPRSVFFFLPRPPPVAACGCWTFFLSIIFLAISSKVSLTFSPLLALVPTCSNPFWRAYDYASSKLTALVGRSHLFPAITIGVSLSRYFLSSSAHYLTLAKESTSVWSYTMRAPAASR